jgi:hypothetical protein
MPVSVVWRKGCGLVWGMKKKAPMNEWNEAAWFTEWLKLARKKAKKEIA